MQINHLHLHVQDVNRSRAFYERYFGMRLKKTISPDFIFLTDDADMDFALSVEGPVPAVPDWFHFGFRLADADQVRQLREKINSDGIPVEAVQVYGKRVTFGLQDPDGYGVEVYFD